MNFLQKTFYWTDIKNKNLTYILSDKGLVNVKKGKNAVSYFEMYCGFDIETTQLCDKKTAYMYHWQISINEYTICGRKWKEFIEFLDMLKKCKKLNENHRLIIWVANLSFEFSFFQNWVNVTRVFAKDMHNPLLVEIDNGCIEFREVLSITGGGLDYVADTYTNLKKLKGNLDYSKMRNSCTELTNDELLYCVHDVQILSKWSEYVFDTFIKKEFLPLTKTAIVRKKVKNGVTKDVHKAIRLCYPKTLNMYKAFMGWLYRGGYTHGNALYVNEILTGCNEKFLNKKLNGIHSFDFTSSYPAVMLQEYFPVSIYNKKSNVSYSQFLEYCNQYCVSVDITFYNIRSTTSHSIESKNKCIELENSIIDNGRVRKASKMRVFITELDFQTYREFYKWDGITINNMWYAIRGKLPDYLLNPLIKDYSVKCTLKRQGKKNTKEYMLSKENVNSYYGMCVTSLITEEITWDNGIWSKESIEVNYEKEKSRAFLLPQWGIYISAHARRRILKLCYLMWCDVIYIDTDSLKILNLSKNKSIVHQWNSRIKQLNLKICKERGIDYNVFYDIGCLEWETKKNPYKRFKTLGAKRYIYEDIEGIHSTIAGLPKKSFIDYVKKNNDIEPFEFFNNQMEIELSNKLAHHYNSEPHLDYIDGELMHEKSSTCLYPVSFTLNMEKNFCNLVNTLKERKDKI